MPIFYRLTLTNPPNPYDFLSHKERGRKLHRDTPRTRRMFEGVSVFATTDAARFAAARYPKNGSFIAELDIPEDGSIPYEQTGDDPDHYTLWADAEVLLEKVRSTVAV